MRASTTMETLAGMRPAFDKDGTITAANASQLSDGASAVIVMSKAEADKRGVTPLGEFVSYGMVAGPDSASLLTQPSRAIMQAADKAGVAIGDLDLFEINEAFAAVGRASIDELGISDEIVNVNGGAIALGHPIGMSGNRLALDPAARTAPSRRRDRRRRRCAAAAARATRSSSRPSDERRTVDCVAIAARREISRIRSARRPTVTLHHTA